MADSPSSILKRPHPEGSQHEGAQKKMRSTNGSPAPQPTGAATGKPDMAKIIAEAKARAAALTAKVQIPSNKPDHVLPVKHSQQATSTESSGLSRAEQLRARVSAALKSGPASEQRASPIYQSPSLDDGASIGRGGLGIGLHPSLLEPNQGSLKNKQAVQPKFATTKANGPRTQSPASQKPKQLDLLGPDSSETRSNPFFDASLGGANVKARNRRQLAFNQKGKYLQQGQALRRQAALEKLKLSVAASARKAGLDEDISEARWKKEEPPSVEWWEEALLISNNYDELDKAKIDTEDSIITAFVQHPVLIEPPSIKNMAPPKPLPLTKQEMAKKRRMTRMANLKEEQAKQRLGLIDTPEPKVKLGNMMRVMGEEAVKDPTAVEAKVNKGIAERKAKHLQLNESRKLTKEEKHEKLEENKGKDEAKGIHVTVFKVSSLANGRHRFKVNKNAEQMSLTGGCYVSPKQVLIIAEGGNHSIQAFKKLMLQRIVWSENDPAPVREGNQRAKEAWLQAEEEDGTLKDLSSNQVTLLWEGEMPRRAFKKFNFKVVSTDKEAMEALSRAKMENFWTQAKSVQ